jgi:acyl-CoA dehydrogenase
MTAISIDEFEREATAFLEASVPERAAEEKFVWGEGPDGIAAMEERDRETELREVAAAQDWRRKKFDAGFGWITGPEQYGGRALPAAFDRRWQQLEARYVVPNQTPFTIGLGMVAPTILAHGTDVTKDAYLTALYRADVMGCQLFSEPGAGSDLASLQTRADRDGEEWVLNGQKVWTSGAQYSDIGEVIARTDPNLPKHRGLTGFIVDMHDPGVEIRPLRQMTGGANFNEVFFTDVRIPDSHRLSDVNNGWNVALTTLMNERAAIGTGGVGGVGGQLVRLLETVRHFGLGDDPLIRQELANLLIHHRVAGYTNQRAMDRIKAGGLPGPEMSIAKLAGTQTMQRMSHLLGSILGPRLIADQGEWGTYSWSAFVLGAPGGRIAGGSDEIMRNIVAERVLGLPKEPGIDTTSPFKDLKVGTQTSA